MSVEKRLENLETAVNNHVLTAIAGLKTDVNWLKALAILVLAGIVGLFFK
jgi:hypothetical protein